MTLSNGWLVVSDTEGTHVIPRGEFREHALSCECWCGPVPDLKDPYVIIHNSIDGREFYERGEKKPN